MNNNEKNYSELEKEYRSELKKLNNKQNIIIAVFVVISFGLSVFLLHCKKYNCFIISISLFFALYTRFYFSYEKPLIDALKEKVNNIFEGEEKRKNLISFEKYIKDEINKKTTILNLTPWQAIQSSFIYCFLSAVDKSFNNNVFYFNDNVTYTYICIFAFALIAIKILEFFDKKPLAKRLIKIIDDLII